ncbi:MAG: hypothetical protein STHCBS139747_002305 [Sporothrix thermara]
MKFSLCIAALISVAVALPAGLPQGQALARRQKVEETAPAMTDSNGNVVPFNSASVFKPSRH